MDPARLGSIARPRSGRSQALKIALVLVLGLLLAAAAGVVAGRVGEPARFVTWSVTAFTVFAGAVACLGLWVGLATPRWLVVGVLPGLAFSYVLLAMPLAVIAVVLLGVAVVAMRAREIAAGVAMTVGVVMVTAVVAQGPAVECGDASVSSGSGPWWIRSPTHWSGSSTVEPDGRSSGATQVGSHRYVFMCVDGQLSEFRRAD